MEFAPTACLRLLALYLALGALACGGSVDNGQASDQSGSGLGDSGSGSAPTLLSDCNPGFPKAQASTDKPCVILDGDTCYSKQDDACGCICPRNQGPVMCVTGNDDQRVAGVMVMWVVCHAVP